MTIRSAENPLQIVATAVEQAYTKKITRRQLGKGAVLVAGSLILEACDPKPPQQSEFDPSIKVTLYPLPTKMPLTDRDVTLLRRQEFEKIFPNFSPAEAGEIMNRLPPALKEFTHANAQVLLGLQPEIPFPQAENVPPIKVYAPDYKNETMSSERQLALLSLVDLRSGFYESQNLPKPIVLSKEFDTSHTYPDYLLTQSERDEGRRYVSGTIYTEGSTVNVGVHPVISFFRGIPPQYEPEKFEKEDRFPSYYREFLFRQMILLTAVEVQVMKDLAKEKNRNKWVMTTETGPSEGITAVFETMMKNDKRTNALVNNIAMIATLSSLKEDNNLDRLLQTIDDPNVINILKDVRAGHIVLEPQTLVSTLATEYVSRAQAK